MIRTRPPFCRSLLTSVRSNLDSGSCLAAHESCTRVSEGRGVGPAGRVRLAMPRAATDCAQQQPACFLMTASLRPACFPCSQ